MSALSLHAEPVRPEWIDYNGHLSEAYYVLVFGNATDALYEVHGAGRAAIYIALHLTLGLFAVFIGSKLA